MSAFRDRCGRVATAKLVLVGAFAIAAAAFGPNPALAEDTPYSNPPEREFRAKRTTTERRSSQRSERERVTRREKAPVARERETASVPVLVRKPAPGQPPDPLLAVISLSDQRMHVYDRTGVVADTRVSTGQAGHRTPAGIYSVIQRNRYHHSNIYSGAPMPWMQRITWSGIAMHAGVVPGYPASHGCIRLPYDFAPKMWSLGRIGMRVVVAPSGVDPVEIEHANLPAPVITPVPASEAAFAVRTAAATEGTDEPPRLLEPYQFAHVRKAKAARTLADLERALKPAYDRAQEASAEAAKASDRLRSAQAALAAAEAKLARSNSEDKGVAVVIEIDAARKALAEVRVEEAAASDAAFAAAKAVRDTETAISEAAEAAKQAAGGLEPVSVFVSRKEGRIYVRQSFAQLLDEPIQIGDPERPLGTHVFTAIEAKDGGAALRWLAVTLPSTPPEIVEEQSKSRRKGREAAAPAPKPTLPASDAAGALERISIPEATRKLIADRLWAGASLVISDYAASQETGRGTDFIVQPR